MRGPWRWQPSQRQTRGARGEHGRHDKAQLVTADLAVANARHDARRETTETGRCGATLALRLH
eukprot:9955882-Alexandrium_andersonii.AAC.1